MSQSGKVSSDDIRDAFSKAMSGMYRTEVPAYGTLMELVADVNAAVLKADPGLKDDLERTDSLARISDERHGAIRLGTPAELAMIRRVFAVMGMFPVGYYDLSVAGIPVHSTAFRPAGAEALSRNPFRVFTSLLRLDLIADAVLAAEAERVLQTRHIFTPAAIALVEKAERTGGLDQEDASRFVTEVLETFRWHDKAIVDADLYKRLHDAHRLIADVVSFKGPHINHLTPRTLDIDAVQAQMPSRGIAAKAVVEGPPTRKCPILLRQTSFKALEEPVAFRGADGQWGEGTHTARFGEIEQRGLALTPEGRALYDRLLDSVRTDVRPAADGKNAETYEQTLSRVFEVFPDDWETLRKNKLGYFTYSLTAAGHRASGHGNASISELVDAGFVQADPIVYEDFLPVSAAGIFQSNLGDHATEKFDGSASQAAFEAALGAPVLNEFAHYADIQQASIENCLALLKSKALRA